eukprot:scaffold14601_cov33-Phaeocystis_antarctica.AAC.1
MVAGAGRAPLTRPLTQLPAPPTPRAPAPARQRQRLRLRLRWAHSRVAALHQHVALARRAAARGKQRRQEQRRSHHEQAEQQQHTWPSEGGRRPLGTSGEKRLLVIVIVSLLCVHAQVGGHQDGALALNAVRSPRGRCQQVSHFDGLLAAFGRAQGRGWKLG